MHRFSLALLLACAPARNSAPAFDAPVLAAQAPSERIAITQVTLIDGTGSPPEANMTVVIEGDRITAVGKTHRLRTPPRTEVINGRGKYLIPGLIDTHVHLAWDLDRHFLLSTEEQLRLLYLPNGVTTIREASSRGLERQTLAVRDSLPNRVRPIPRIHASGRVDVQNIARYKAASATDLTRQLIALGVDAIKIRYGLTLPQIQETVLEARKTGTPVWGHTYFHDDYTPDAILAGVTGITHVQGFPQTGSRVRPDAPPADTSWQLQELYRISRWLHTDEAATESLIGLMVERGVWLEPTLTTLDFVRSADRLRSNPDRAYSVRPYEQIREGHLTLAGEELVRFNAAFDRMKNFVRRFHLRGGMVIAGTDVLPFVGFGIHDELELLVEAGLTPMAALQAATRNAARALKWDDKLGTVQVGKHADLVLLDANPLADIRNSRAINAVVTRGTILSRSSIDAMLGEAAAAISRK